ncbi:unnamed protein product [Paramecium octaurelia]|uniref:RING-type domain-containing protein n=1 Tax=Paramecium octaurelia TaxID=43137 RepID=A0A8S1S1A6_PAROT|nr:unnamed protein product [Paramecium octaurelia]
MQHDSATLKLIKQDFNQQFEEKIHNFQEQINKQFKFSCLFCFIIVVIFLGNFNDSESNHIKLHFCYNVWITSLFILHLLKAILINQQIRLINENHIIIALWKNVIQKQENDLELQDLTGIENQTSVNEITHINEGILFPELLTKLDFSQQIFQTIEHLLDFILLLSAILILIINCQQNSFQIDELIIMIGFVGFSIKRNIQYIKKYSYILITPILFPFIVILISIGKLAKRFNRHILQKRLRKKSMVSDQIYENCQLCQHPIQIKECIIQLECKANHAFHYECIINHIQHSFVCPVCSMLIK